MKHDDMRHMLSEYLDGSVSAGEKAEIEEHLKSCPECSNALRELQKTVEHIKAVEEVDSPAWMTRKIMAKVRAEAEEKKGIFRKLFLPLHIKLPLEAVAVLFLAVTTYYISQEMRPEMKLAQAPPEKVIVGKEAPSVVTVGKGEPSVIAKDQVLKQSRKPKTALTREREIAPPAAVERKPAFVPLPSKPAGEPMPETASGAKADRFAAPAAPSPAEERAVKESEAVAPAKKREAVPSAGFVAMDESRREVPAPAPRAKALAYAEKKNKGAGSNEFKLDKIVSKKHSNGTPETILTYKVMSTGRYKIAEERFNDSGERHGIQLEYYDSGQIKAKAQYGHGKLEWYMEFYPDGTKKTEKSEKDWIWLKR